jgi:hypothetical protein
VLAVSMTIGIVLVGVALAGCGGDGGDSPGDVTRDFSEAMADNNGRRACDLMTGDAQRQMILAGAFFGGKGEGCPGGVEAIVDTLDAGELDALRNVEIGPVKISGDRATVRVKDGLDIDEDEGPVRLRKVEGEWLVDVDPDE